MIRKLLFSVGLSYAVLGVCSSGALAQSVPEPWKEPQDTFMSLFESDRYAWRLFVALNWPGDVTKKEADSAKKLGADGSVAWETWRSVNPLAPDTVFRTDGADPGPWLGTIGPVVSEERQRFERVLSRDDASLAISRRRLKAAPPSPSFEGGGGDEVRMNLGSYTFVRTNNLYNVEGQIQHFTAGEVNLNFPPNAKLVKASWRTIDVSDKPRYHWAEITRANGTKEVFGLSALHVLTKDLPNWFWATFEHIDAKPGWQNPSVDKFACPSPPHNCEQVPPNLGLQGTKWENYRLRGSQVDFITSMGMPTVLANSQLEAIQNSSCMTCHAMASINGQGGNFGFQFIKGSPQPVWFQNSSGQRVFMQQDFVWSLTRASRVNP
jgi:hypothetical protein